MKSLILICLAPSLLAEPLFVEPDITETKVATDCVIGEVFPGNERFYVRIGNYGKTTPIVPQAWDASSFTGLKVPAGFQFGPMAAENSAAVQVHGREVGIWIDSDHPRPALGSLLPITPAYWWWDMNRAPFPFKEAGRELSISFALKVPTASRTGEAQVYITTNFLLRDKRSQQQFWLASTVFDPRGEAHFPDLVHVDDWEGGTQLPILFCALHHKSQWLHPGPASALFADTTFSDYRHFEVRVSSAELRTAIVAMKKAKPKLAAVSEDSHDYQLIHLSLNPEVFAPKGSRGRLGLALRDIRVEVIK